MAIDKVKLPDNSVEEVRDSRIPGIDSAPTANSTNLVTSGGVKSALDGYLPLTGGTMTNTNFVTNLNADLLDGKHASDFIGVNDNAASATVIKETTLEDEEFTYQATPVHDIADAYRIDRIKGKTLAWNQILTDINEAAEVYGITRTRVGPLKLHYSGTSTESTIYTATTQFSVILGHKYYMATKGISSPCHINYATSGDSVIITADFSGNTSLAVFVPAGTTIDADVSCQCHDLTLMFGAGNEPSTVEEFEAMFPLPYYDYNPGELISVAADGIETVGFNLFDEEIMSGWNYITRNADGWSGALNRFYLHRCFENTFNYTGRVFINMNYSLDEGTGFLTAYYVDGTYNDFRLDSATRATVGYETPAGKVIDYIEFSYTRNGTLTIHSLCINLSDASRNGQYEPHWSKVLPLGLDSFKVKDSQGNITTITGGLKSAGSVYDEIVGNKYIKKIGEVDLGSLAWYVTSGGIYGGTFYADVDNRKTGINILCGNYSTVSLSENLPDKCITEYAANDIAIRVNDTAYTTAEAFKTAMSGVYLYYELATPVEYDLVAPMPFSGKIDGYGTMRVISDNIVAPFNGDITYGCNPGQIAADSNALMGYVNSVFDLRHYETSQPSGGMLPDRQYALGELSGDTTFAMAAGSPGVTNHYFWTFSTPSTAPTITWPAAITSWYGGSAPTINASKHYEVSVLDGVAICMEV